MIEALCLGELQQLTTVSTLSPLEPWEDWEVVIPPLNCGFGVLIERDLVLALPFGNFTLGPSDPTAPGDLFPPVGVLFKWGGNSPLFTDI